MRPATGAVRGSVGALEIRIDKFKSQTVDLRARSLCVHVIRVTPYSQPRRRRNETVEFRRVGVVNRVGNSRRQFPFLLPVE